MCFLHVQQHVSKLHVLVSDLHLHVNLAQSRTVNSIYYIQLPTYQLMQATYPYCNDWYPTQFKVIYSLLFSGFLCTFHFPPSIAHSRLPLHLSIAPCTFPPSIAPLHLPFPVSRQIQVLVVIIRRCFYRVMQVKMPAYCSSCSFKCFRGVLLLASQCFGLVQAFVRRRSSLVLACPGLSASEEHLLMKARTGPKRREARSRTPQKHLNEQEEQ